MEAKKILAPTIIAIATLLVLVVGATYAYFSVTANNNFGTKTIEASMASVGSVALASGSNLSMSLTAVDMMKQSSDVTYYATSSGKSTTSTSPVIATATVTGEGTFTCNYSIVMKTTATNSMYTAFQGMTGKTAGQIVLTVAGNTYDFNTANLFASDTTISGSMTGLTSSASKTLTAQLKVVNKASVDQSALAGTDIKFEFSVSSFTCTATA